MTVRQWIILTGICLGILVSGALVVLSYWPPATGIPRVAVCLPTAPDEVLLRVCRDAMADANVPDEVRREQLSELGVILGENRSYLKAPSVPASNELRQSLRNLLRTLPVSRQRGSYEKLSSYWLSLCIIHALDRPYLSAEQQAEVLASYEASVRDIMPRIRSQLLAQFEGDNAQRHASTVDSALDAFRRKLDESVRLYQGDYLCPGFHEKATPDVAVRLMKRLEHLHYPNFTEPAHPLMTLDEHIRRSLRVFLNDLLHLCLYEMFLGEHLSLVKYNDYWGHSSYSVVGVNPIVIDAYLGWPAIVAIEPDAYANETLGWRRR